MTDRPDPFPLYLMQVTALSVVMAWVYANTRQSLVPVMLLHAAVNNTGAANVLCECATSHVCRTLGARHD